MKTNETLKPSMSAIKTVCQKGYQQELGEKAKSMASILLDYKTQQTQDRVLKASMFQNVGIYVSATDVIPSDSNNQNMSILHISQLSIEIVRECTHYILTSLENRLLVDNFDINRLKLSFVSMP